MKIYHFNIIFIFLLLVGLGYGQANRKPRKKAPKKSPVVSNKIPIISFGVMNVRAIDLKLPEFPKAASAVNVYGQVQVRIMVDQLGIVIKAEAVKGHPLLRSAAEAAALKSTFQPFSWGGELVWVDGYIHYNFSPRSNWNWLEIGYTIGGGNSYYSIRELKDRLPDDFADEAHLAQSTDTSTIITIIQSKLSGNRRSKWLFDLGIAITKLGSVGRGDNTELKATGLEIENLSLSAPYDISPILLKQLKRLKYIIDHPDERNYDPLYGDGIYQLISRMEEQFPFIGR